MMEGIWMREWGEKIRSGDEVVCKICQDKYKKNVTKNKGLFWILWITFKKPIMWPRH